MRERMLHISQPFYKHKFTFQKINTFTILWAFVVATKSPATCWALGCVWVMVSPIDCSILARQDCDKSGV
jgi:hypothetical protein